MIIPCWTEVVDCFHKRAICRKYFEEIILYSKLGACPKANFHHDPPERIVNSKFSNNNLGKLNVFSKNHLPYFSGYLQSSYFLSWSLFFFNVAYFYYTMNTIFKHLNYLNKSTLFYVKIVCLWIWRESESYFIP